jgi:hypothetical protein
MSAYLVAGSGFFIATLLLAWYITGYGLKPAQHFSIGLKAILISYLLGTVALLFVITLT